MKPIIFGTNIIQDICRDMLEEYVDKILQVKKIHNSQNCYISANGDAISGNIHKTISFRKQRKYNSTNYGRCELN